MLQHVAHRKPEPARGFTMPPHKPHQSKQVNAAVRSKKAPAKILKRTIAEGVIVALPQTRRLSSAANRNKEKLMLQPVAHRKPGPARLPGRHIIMPSIGQFLEVNLQDCVPEALDNTRYCPSIPRMARMTHVVTQA